MAITLVGVTSGRNTGGANNVLSKPAGVQAGDLLIAILGLNGSTTATWTPASGWTAYHANTANGEVLRVFYLVAGASEPSTYTFTSSTSMSGGFGIIALRGQQGNILAISSDGADGGNTASHTAPSVSFSTADVVSIIIGTWQAGAATVTWPGGWTEAWNIGDDPTTPFEVCVAAYNLTTVSAATSLPSKTFTTSVGNFGQANQLAIQLGSTSTPAIRDAAGRARLMAQAFRNAAGRARLQAQAFRNAAGRFRFAVAQWRFATGRVRLRATAWRDAAGRFRLAQLGANIRDAAGRVRIRVNAFRDASGRARMAVAAFRNALGRFRLRLLAPAAPRINLGLPAFASDISFPPSNLTDDNYANQIATDTLPYWFAYDLSGLASGPRTNVALLIDNETGNFFIGPNQGYPTTYTIETSTHAGGGSPPGDSDPSWNAIATITGNVDPRRMHVLGNLSAVNWLRVRITAVANDSTAGELHLNALDLFDCRSGILDSWMIIGDSTTEEGGGLGDATTGFEWTGGPIARHVHTAAGLGAHWPILISAGNGGMDMQYAHDNISTFLANFPGKWVVMQMGLNDANTDADLSQPANASIVATWYSNLLFCVDAILAAGKIPVLGKIQWASAKPTTAGNGTVLNAKVDQALIDRPLAFPGPDMYSAFNGQTSLLRADHLHPSFGVGGGYELWISTMASSIATFELAASYRDAPGRVRLAIAGQSWRDANGRVRLAVRRIVDATGRVRLAVGAFRNAQGRVRIVALGQAWRDAQGRTRLLATAARDAPGRARLAVQATRDAAGRAKMRATSWRDAAGRISIAAIQRFRDGQGRVRMAAPTTRDAAGRFFLKTQIPDNRTLVAVRIGWPPTTVEVDV